MFFKRLLNALEDQIDPRGAYGRIDDRDSGDDDVVRRLSRDYDAEFNALVGQALDGSDPLRATSALRSMAQIREDERTELRNRGQFNGFTDAEIRRLAELSNEIDRLRAQANETDPTCS